MRHHFLFGSKDKSRARLPHQHEALDLRLPFLPSTPFSIPGAGGSDQKKVSPPAQPPYRFQVQRASRLPFADEENMRGATSHVSPFFLERPVFGVWLCWFLWLLLWVVFVLLSCFSFDGLSSDQTYESTYDSMPGVAKTATIVMMSAASVQKKTLPS